MSIHVPPPSVDFCHLTMVPVLPFRVRVPLLDPWQAVEVEELVTVPPTEVGLTLTVTVKVLPTQLPDVGVTV